MTTSGSTMERIVPDDLTDGFGVTSLQLHYERYRFAGKNIEPGRLLDIACGTGYGSNLLANDFGDSITEIVGVDISADSISYAQRRYANPKTTFLQHDALTFCDQNKFNTIVTLETIEHLQNPASFIRSLCDLLKPGGTLIASAPVTLSTDVNPYHLTDFTEKSFRALFATSSFSTLDILHQIQPVSLKDIFDKKNNQRAEGMRSNLISYYISHPKMLVARAQSILQHGFSNKYMVLALRKNTRYYRTD